MKDKGFRRVRRRKEEAAGQEAVGEQTTEVQRQAGQEMVVVLGSWKQRVRRMKIYRGCLLAALILSCIALVGMTYYAIDSSIPSVIHVRLGQEETFRLGVPAKAEIQGVSGQGESNIPDGAVEIDLSRTITMLTDTDAAYQMEVKLFGFLPIKQVGIRVIQDQELIPVGSPIGIYVKTDGVLVVGTGEFTNAEGADCSPSKNILRSGDYIRKMNGEAVEDKDTFIKKVRENGGDKITLTVEREGELIQLAVQPVRDAGGEYKIGAWVRDNAQGVGTMTYIDSQGRFGALGHGINDVDTSTLMHMENGTLYQTDIIDIKRGTIGKPGEMTGMIIYADDRILGQITDNSSRGIFGVCNEKALAMGDREALPIGLKQDIKKGPAQILCTVAETAKYYDVEITDIHLDHDNINRGIELTVTDPELLELTGGIVQGMSGSPIIQNGRFVGAVTHVLVNDPTRGYGIFIENMLECN